MFLHEDSTGNSSPRASRQVLVTLLILLIALSILVPKTEISGQSGDGQVQDKLNTALAHLSQLLGRTFPNPSDGSYTWRYDRNQYASDGSLGCAAPGQSYPQIRTHYLAIIINVSGGSVYEYRFSLDGGAMVYLRDGV